MPTAIISLDTPLSVGQEADAMINDHLIGLTDPRSDAFESYLVLRLALERARTAHDLRVVAFTSATVGDGKTTTSINVAAALAQNRRSRVLLIDADLRMPSVGRQLGTPADTPGLAELLVSASSPLASAVTRRSEFNLSVLTAGCLNGANPYDLFHAPRFKALLDEARASYDHIVVDTPPVVHVADCGVIAPQMDTFVVVVAAHRTPRRLLAEALTILGPEKVFGMVLNRADRPFRGAYYGYPGYSPATRDGRTWTAR